MTFWPWRGPAPASGRQAPETRQAYSELVVSALLAAASGRGDESPLAIGALEAAAGAYSRAFAAATVAGAKFPAITPAVLASIARSLVRYGESLHVIQVDPAGRLALLPAVDWTVRGGPDPAGWRYQATMVGPDTTETRTVDGAGVLHCRLAYDVRRPWAGVAPLEWAGRTGRLAAHAERVTGDEAAGPVGMVLPVPEAQPEPAGDEDGEEAGPTDPLAVLRADLTRLRGGLATVETTGRGWGDSAAAPFSDWTVKRFGPAPPAGLVELRTAVEHTVYAAVGVPLALVDASDGTSGREAWRRFLHGSVAPLARLVETELQAKLDAPGLVLSFAALAAADRTGAARAWRSLVGREATMADAEARRLAGLA